MDIESWINEIHSNSEDTKDIKNKNIVYAK